MLLLAVVLLIPLSGVFLLHPQPSPQRSGPGLLLTSPQGILAFPWLLTAPMGACGYLIHIHLQLLNCKFHKGHDHVCLVPSPAALWSQDSMTEPHPLSPYTLVLTFSRYLPPLSLRTLPPAPTTSLLFFLKQYSPSRSHLQ